MKTYKTDVAVLVIFFTRHHTLKLVADAIRKARPSKLFLYQDGAREGREDDIENINKCRELFSEIDWECEIHRKYQEKNVGCDPSVYLAIKWMFQYVDKGIIIEDDVVPTQSFFPFCAELLEKYQDNERIHLISGMNRLEKYPKDYPYDYFFSKTGTLWGWATWKRVVDTWDAEYAWMDNPKQVERIRAQFSPHCLYHSPRVNFDVFLMDCKRHKESGRAHFETIQAASKFLFDRVCITPANNMTENVGMTGESTHGLTELRRYPKGYQKIFTMKSYDCTFPLRHPKIAEIDKKYPVLCEKVLGTHFITRRIRILEQRIRKIMYR